MEEVCKLLGATHTLLYHQMRDRGMLSFQQCGGIETNGRHFVKWNRNDPEIYQGEVNEKGEREGRGITISSDSITVGWTKNRLSFGNYIKYSQDA